MNIDLKIIDLILKRKKRQKSSVSTDGLSWKIMYKNKEYHILKIKEYIENYKFNNIEEIQSYKVSNFCIYVPNMYERVVQLYFCEILEKLKKKEIPMVIRRESLIKEWFFNKSKIYNKYYCTHLDIKHYFNSITIKHVESLILSFFNTDSVTRNMILQMIRFGKNGEGLLVGFPLNSYIADHILLFIDVKLINDDVIRFHDDFFVYHKKPNMPLSINDKIFNEIVKLNFEMNSSKIKTLQYPFVIYDFFK